MARANSIAKSLYILPISCSVCHAIKRKHLNGVVMMILSVSVSVSVPAGLSLFVVLSANSETIVQGMRI